MRAFSDLAAAASFFAGLGIEAEKAKRVALEKAAVIVEKEAKRVIGSYEYGWPALKPQTIARKANGDTPLLETGELRDSIEHTVRGNDALIGSNLDVAVYQELGTSRGIPPRSFLAGAAIHKEREVIKTLGKTVVGVLANGELYSQD